MSANDRSAFPAGSSVLATAGGGFRSALAADNLRKMGYTDVQLMDGGFRGWTEAGFDVEKG